MLYNCTSEALEARFQSGFLTAREKTDCYEMATTLKDLCDFSKEVNGDINKIKHMHKQLNHNKQFMVIYLTVNGGNGQLH